MAIESFFKIKTKVESLKKLLEDYTIEFDEDFDEFTFEYSGYNIWLSFYFEDEDPDYIYINVKYESKINKELIDKFKNSLIEKGFIERNF